MRVCHIVPSLAERHGGPSKSVRALADAMGGAGASVGLLTTLEPGEAPPARGVGAAELRVFPRVAPQRLCRSPELRAHLLREDYACVHNHALWLLPLRYAHEAARAHGAPLVVAPRGMMSGWAWRHHHWRKRLAELCVHPGAFAAAAGWHATSAQEADDIRALGFRQPVCVAPNGVTIPGESELAAAREVWNRLCPAATGRPVALFYSRFHRKKRLRELIQLWAARPRGDWFLLIAGVPEEYSVEEVRGWLDAAGLGAHAAVFDGRGCPPPYAVASLFLLPTHSENFGLVVAEALAAGVPAVVTDTAPWGGLAEHGAGWLASWDDYPAVLAEALATPAGTRAEMGARGRAWMAREFTWDGAARRLLGFYSSLRHE